MKRRSLKARRLVLAAVLSAAVAAIALAFVPAAIEGTSNRHDLSAFVVVTQRGPLPRCSDDGSDCTAANIVWWFIHIVNGNRLSNFPPTNGSTRANTPNAFLVSSVDETTFINGVEYGHGTLTPPPNLTGRFGTAGHWPETVTCGQPGAFTTPCNVVTSPAVVPGENTVIFYEGWFHGQSDPGGIVVTQFTVHGTLNGAPVDVTASSPPIFQAR
jgi:hypothetical protein